MRTEDREQEDKGQSVIGHQLSVISQDTVILNVSEGSQQKTDSSFALLVQNDKKPVGKRL